MKIDALCGNCRYYLTNPQEVTAGFCYYSPPRPALVGGQGSAQLLALRPPIKLDEMGCSKFTPKDQLLDAGVERRGEN